MTYLWDFGDGTATVSTAPPALSIHTPPAGATWCS
ncbi:MAG TPA: hypothetical protein EYM36_09420 [Acidobacteria bacterium]|nr:hypothetical protein [Acidobacteriota bacterium]